MKNPKHELFRRKQRQYHLSHPWRLSQGGLYVAHCYADKKPDSLSWWDDAGFILNDRRVIVWWAHPRLIYSDAIADQALAEAGDSPHDVRFSERDRTPNYRKVGKSRKKVVAYTVHKPLDKVQRYYDKVSEIENRLTKEGIELEVSPSWKRKCLNWATGIELVAPLEVRNETELAVVAALARRLILSQTVLEAEFPGYRYGKADWLRDQELIAQP